MKEQATEAAVWAAADTLQATGQEPTVIVLREQLGGSFTTVQRHLRSWQERQRQTQEIVVPETVQQLASQLGRAVWRTAHEAAQTEVEQARAAAQQTIAQAEAERDLAHTEIARLERAAEEHTAQLTAALERIAALSETLAEARAQAQALAVRADDRERQLQQAQAELVEARQQSSAQIAEAVAAIQQQLTAQAAQLAQLTQRDTKGREQ